jgi:hypothetical protein
MAGSDCFSEAECKRIEQCGAVPWIAECGSITYDADGNPIIDFSAFTKFNELDSFTLTPNREVSKSKKLGGCTTSCSVRVNDYSGAFTMCMCMDDIWHCRLANPTEACGFDWILFPCPANTDAPDPATEAYFFGSGVTSGSGAWEFTADDVEDLTISIDFEGCGRNMGRANFCDQAPVAPVVQPIQTNATNTGSKVKEATS